MHLSANFPNDGFNKIDTNSQIENLKLKINVKAHYFFHLDNTFFPNLNLEKNCSVPKNFAGSRRSSDNVPWSLNAKSWSSRIKSAPTSHWRSLQYSNGSWRIVKLLDSSRILTRNNQ